MGASVPRLEAREKVTGRARFSDDIKIPGMLAAAVVQSPHAHARIKSCDTAAARAIPGVRAVITGEDFPEHRLGLFIQDQPAMARGKVRYVGEPVAAVAAEDLAAARRAARLIEIEYEVLPAVLDYVAAMSETAPVLHERYADYDKQVAGAAGRNLIASSEFVQGSVDGAWEQCDLILEGEYTLPAQHHLYLEPCSAVVDIDDAGKLNIWSTTQWVFGVQAAVAEALALPQTKVRSVAPFIGGGFGAKYDFTVEPIAARLAQLACRPVRLTLSRDEDMCMMKSRHRGTVRMKTGVRSDGTLLAREAEVTLDGGAYADESPAVLSYALMRAPGPYRIPHLRAVGRAVYTNHLRAGAYRGFGNPQVAFAGESQIDEIAHRLQLDPLELRLKNAIETGDPWLGGTTVEVGTLRECLDTARTAARWQERRARSGALRNGRRRGIGAAAIWHICGLLSAGAALRLLQDGSVVLSTGAVDLGEGADTVMAQICAGVLGLQLEAIGYQRADSDVSPYTFATAGSRTTYMVGHAVEQAALKLRRQILEAGAEMLECAAADLEVRPGGLVGVKGTPESSLSFAEISARSIWEGEGELAAAHRWSYHPHDIDPKRAAAEGYGVGANVFGVQIVEVEVDETTGQVEVTQAWSAHDVGKALNPASVEGQIQGGFVQGMGYALFEQLLWEDGPLLTPTLGDYKVPGMADSPGRVHAIILEHPDPRGPFGAKGIGEPPLVGVGPAIASAVFAATGARIRELPMTAETVLEALTAAP